MSSHLLIAIDGPAGAGKSTVARKVSEKLGLSYIDTGAMFRALAFKALQQHINTEDFKEVSQLLCNTSIWIRGGTIHLDGFPVGDEVRTPAVSALSSKIAKISLVRKYLKDIQQDIARHQSVVMDGRDIGTQILPHADVKIFLTASIYERAVRRYAELQEKGMNTSLEELKRDIALRDETDRKRAIAPLSAASDAILLDTTDKTIEEVVDIICSYCQK